MALFNVLFDIAAKTAKFEEGMRRVEQRLDKTSAFVKKIGAASVAGFSVVGVANYIKGVVDAADAMSTLAQRAQIGVEAFSELAHAADMADVPIESLSTSIKIMQKQISEAAAGTKGSLQAFQELGVSLADIRKLAPDKQFEAIAEAISKVTDPADRARIAMDLFGKAGSDLLPLLQSGAAGIQRFRAEARGLGVTLTEDVAESIGKVDDSLKRLNRSFAGLSRTIVGGLAPALSGGADALRQMLGGATDLERITSELRHINREIDNLGTRDDPNTDAFRASLLRSRAELAKEIAKYERDAVQANRAALAGSDRELVAREESKKKKVKDTFLDTLEIRVESQRIELSAMQQFYKELDEATLSGEEQLVQRVEETRSKLNVLLRDGLIDTTTYNSRIQDQIDAVLQPIEVSSKRMVVEVQKSGVQMSEFAKRAAENMQDAFADFLFDPFSNGLKGMLRGFLDVVRRMVAEAAAAKIFDALKGSGGGGGIGGFLGGLLGGLFKAEGGPVSGGRPYIVGERGPELFVPGMSGGIVPNGELAGAGGVSITIQNTIDARGSSISRAELNAALNQSSEVTVAKVRDLVARGRL